MGKQYGIMRIEKRNKQAVHGIEIENNRTADKRRNFIASDIDWERTKDNEYFIHCEDWNAEINKIINDAGAKTRKDSVVMLDGLYTASPEFFQESSKAEIRGYFRDCLKFHEKHYGKVFNAVVHWDEATPHLHIVSVPITADGRLSAKEIMGNRKEYHERQNAFYDDVAFAHWLERGEIRDNGEKRKHLDSLQFKSERAKEQAEISLRESEAALDQRDKARAETKELRTLPHREKVVVQKEKELTKREAELSENEKDFQERCEALEYIESRQYTKEDIERAKERERKRVEEALKKVSKETKTEFERAYAEVSRNRTHILR